MSDDNSTRGIQQNPISLEEKVDQLDEIGRPMQAIARFLESRDKRIPRKEKNTFHRRVVELLSDDEFRELVNQFKYAGRVTLNYFVIEGICEYSLDDIEDRVRRTFLNQEEVGNSEGGTILSRIRTVE